MNQDNNTATSFAVSHTSSPCNFLLLPSPPPLVVLSPCAACKILRRRCSNECVLAPHFPPTVPLNFVVVHKIFGAGNVIKFLQEVPEHWRADTAGSLVYEANARIRDPVYGCAGQIYQLQNQLTDLHAQLAIAKAQLHNMQLHQANLLHLISTQTTQFQHQQDDHPISHHQRNKSSSN